MKKIIFLVSGNGGTLKFLCAAINALQLPLEIVKVVADRKCGAYDFACAKKIDAEIISYNQENNQELVTRLKDIEVDLIVTNIHKILDIDVLNLHADKFINLHYSLLPAFGGLFGMKTVDAAKKQNVQFVGGTCHKVSEKVDAGEIICQGCFAVDWSKPIEDVYDQVFQVSCLAFLNSVIIILDIFSDPTQNQLCKNFLINPKIRFEPLSNDFFEQKIKNILLGDSYEQLKRREEKRSSSIRNQPFCRAYFLSSLYFLKKQSRRFCCGSKISNEKFSLRFTGNLFG